MTELILTEKHSVAADFAKALGAKKRGGFFEGGGYTITWAVGHLVELYEPEDYDKGLKRWRLETLPLIPETFKYKPMKKSYDRLKVIKSLLKQKDVSQVIIATDAGREGEVIARTILLEAGFTDKSRIKRFWTSQALVPEVVRKSMKELRPVTDYDRLWRAGYYRQVSDWLVGMNCTRVLTVRLKDLFSVGRVQTAVLALLADRKRERGNFVPETYWIIKVLFENQKGSWIGYWFKNKETQITKREDVTALVEKLAGDPPDGVVLSVKKERKREAPPFLFSLTDLQQEANKKFGFPAKTTLNIAQALYQDKKCLSYPRTDSRVLGTQNLDMVRDIIQKLSGSYGGIFQNIDQSKISLSNKRVFNDAKLTDHHALIPFKAIPERATSDEKKIFDLVIRRFSAAFHPDCQFENTRVVTELKGETFQTRGKVILVSGWREVYKEQVKEKETVENIPPLMDGDPAIRRKAASEEKQTTPPPEYNDALLLKDMTNPGKYVSEEEIKKIYRGDVGIGTQSTRAQIIETLISRKYVERSGKKLAATEKGSFLVDMLRKTTVAGVLTSPEETARWEMNLNRIAMGEETDTPFLPHIKKFVTDAVNELKTAAFDSIQLKTTIDDSKIIGPCPACRSDVCENRKGYGCTGRTAENEHCGFVIWKRIAGKNISPQMAENLLRYRKSGPFKGFVSKNKKRFSASLKVTNEDGEWKVSFDFDKPLSEKKQAPTPHAQKAAPSRNTSTPSCPSCGGRIIEGNKGYGCSNWRQENGACKFVIWKDISGKKLTQKNVETLVSGKPTRPYVLKNQEGRKFNAKLQMIQARPGLFAIQILPEERPAAGMPSPVLCKHA